MGAYSDSFVELNLFIIILISIERIQTNIMIDQLLPDLHLELLSLVQCQAVALRNNRNNVDNLTQLLHDDDINWAKRMASGADKVKATMYTRVLNVAVTHRSQLLAKIRGVLVFDVFNNGIPTV